MLEVLPLTHIRGRSLHDAFVIVDEAQSLERNVLLTVLSRIGQGSRVVLTHDVAQRDNLRVGRHDGVAAVIEALKGHPLFAHVTLDPVRAVADRRAGHRDARGPRPVGGPRPRRRAAARVGDASYDRALAYGTSSSGVAAPQRFLPPPTQARMAASSCAVRSIRAPRHSPTT